MQHFEVTFSIYKSGGPGRATIGSSLTSNLRTTVAATSATAARSMVQAQYGSACQIFAVRPLSET